MNSLRKVSSQLAQLTACTAKAGGLDRIYIRNKESDSVHFEAVDAFSDQIDFFKQQMITHIPIAKHLFGESEPVAVVDGGMMGYLASLFGHKRLQRILERANIEEKETASLSGTEVATFCAHAAEVYEADLQELLLEIISGGETIRFLDKEDSRRLRDDFRGVHTLDECSKEHLEAMFSILIPSNTISSIFSKVFVPFVPDIFPQGALVADRGDYYEKIRQKPPTEEEWFMIIAKKLVNLKIPEGVVFRNGHGGFCTVHSVVSEEGAYKCFLKQIGPPQEGVRNVVVYRGTIVSDHYTFLEDARSEFGSQGPQATFEKTKKLLTDPQKGFVRSENEPVVGVGMSLGACHVMRDAVLFGTKFCRIISIAGPGPDKETMKVYAERINNQKEEEEIPEIAHYWDDKDIAYLFGEHHLGADCDPKKIKISINVIETDPEQSQEESVEQAITRIVKGKKFPVVSIPGVDVAQAGETMIGSIRPHIENSFERKQYQVHRLTNRDHPELVNELLTHELFDPQWEKMRQWFRLEKLPFVDKTSFIDYIKALHT